jgi:hypothetical protein
VTPQHGPWTVAIVRSVGSIQRTVNVQHNSLLAPFSISRKRYMLRSVKRQVVVRLIVRTFGKRPDFVGVPQNPRTPSAPYLT